MHHTSEEAVEEEEYCQAGCACAAGHVRDERGACVASHGCPCHHGGRSHAEGATIRRGCNSW
jgi:hypothetical protein